MLRIVLETRVACLEQTQAEGFEVESGGPGQPKNPEASPVMRILNRLFCKVAPNIQKAGHAPQAVGT